MHTERHRVLTRLAGVVATMRVPVIVTAFVGMPLSLNRHAGEPATPVAAAWRHMT